MLQTLTNSLRIADGANIFTYTNDCRKAVLRTLHQQMACIETVEVVDAERPRDSPDGAAGEIRTC